MNDEDACRERAQRLIREGVSGDEGLIASMLFEAVTEEREACANIAETVVGDFERDTTSRTESDVRRGIADAIRKRERGGGAAMRDGDIYFWHFKDEGVFDYDLYHCKSRKAIVMNGRLVDTFWATASDGYVVDPNKCVLEFKGNKNALRKIGHWEAPYYDAADVVDMRHRNSPRDAVFVKADARRSREAMLLHIAFLIETQESVVMAAKHRLQLLTDARSKVEAGELDKVFL